ncbi:MAG TPA: MFS transporter [Alphaproteobacteria bacterium]|nr:MFS transporter [Alphaproteobacteria bacterium]
MSEATSGGDARGKVRLNSFIGVLQHRNYRLYAAGDAVSLIGNWVQKVAIGWLTWQLTESATWLGIVAFCDLCPAIVLSPIGGVIADRGDPRRMSLISQVFAMAQAMALLLLTWAQLIDIWGIVILSVLRGSIAAVNQPARMSMMPNLIPPEDLASAIAFNSVMANMARFIGPAIAGVIIAAGGISSAFAINAVSYLLLLYALWAIDIKEPEPSHHGRRDMWGQIAAGYQYVYQHRGIGPLLLIYSATTILVRPVTELLPGFADRIFDMGAQGLAWMTSAMGLGAMVGGMTMVRRASTERLVKAAVSSLAGLSVSIIAFALVPSFWIGMALLFAYGFSNTGSSIGTQSLVQGSVDEAFRGRVMSLYGVLFRGGPAVGALIIGSLGDTFGLQGPVAAAASLCLLVSAWAMTRRRSLVRHLSKANAA